MTGTAAIYCRISADLAGKGLGVARQEEECRKLAERLGLEVTAVHVDNDMSATKGLTRPGFEAMFEEDVDCWIVWATDRLVRKSTELLRIIDHGPIVHTVQAGPIDLAGPSGRMVAKMLTAVAELEGEQRSARQRAAYRQRAALGKAWWTRRPYGHRMDGTLEPLEAACIASGCEALLRGRKLSEIASDWQQQGFEKRNGQPWNGSDVSQLLKKPRIAGLGTYQGDIVGKGGWEPVVDEGIWRGVVALLKNAGPSPRYGGTGGPLPKSLATGIVRCGHCGATLKARSSRLYVCSGDRGCTSPPREWLDGVIFREVLKALPGKPSAWPGKLATGSDTAAAKLRAEKAELENRITELAVAYTQGTIPINAFSTASQGLQERLERVGVELGKASASWTLLEAVEDVEHIASAWDADLSLNQQRELVKALFGDIVVTKIGRGSRKKYGKRNVKFTVRKEP